MPDQLEGGLGEVQREQDADDHDAGEQDAHRLGVEVEVVLA